MNCRVQSESGFSQIGDFDEVPVSILSSEPSRWSMSRASFLLSASFSRLPAWMVEIDSFTAVKVFGFAVLLVAVNPKNPLLSLGAGSSLTQLGLSTSQAVVSLVVFVVLASVTIAGPHAYYLVRGPRAEERLDAVKGWLVLHNGAVMTVLFVVLGVDLISKGLPPLGS